MNKPIYQCNNCNKRHYSLESLMSCECKFRKGKIKWNNPNSRGKENLSPRLLNWSVWRR